MTPQGDSRGVTAEVGDVGCYPFNAGGVVVSLGLMWFFEGVDSRHSLVEEADILLGQPFRVGEAKHIDAIASMVSD